MTVIEFITALEAVPDDWEIKINVDGVMLEVVDIDTWFPPDDKKIEITARPL